MLFSLALIFLCGFLLGKLFEFIKLPSLIGMIVTGIVLGPYALDLLDVSLLGISAELREIALIIILARAGLNLDINELKKVGRPAILLCFVPALLEIAAVCIFAPILLEITLFEAALMGTVLAAVSPAVIVPRMLKIKDEGYGAKQSIPQMIMAGSSVDDVFVIVLFTVFLSINQSGEFSIVSLINIPLAIILGITVGALLSLLYNFIFTKFHCRDSVKVLIFVSMAFLLVTIEDLVPFGFSGILAVMALGMGIKFKGPKLSARLSNKFSKLWIVAEIMLFALVGASVDISFALNAGINAVLLIIFALVFRVLAVFICLIKTKFSKKEKLFSAVSYIPKATVQAAIGGIPLAMGLECGNIILTVAILAILITATIGAVLIDNLYKKLLKL